MFGSKTINTLRNQGPFQFDILDFHVNVVLSRTVCVTHSWLIHVEGMPPVVSNLYYKIISTYGCT